MSRIPVFLIPSALLLGGALLVPPLIWATPFTPAEWQEDFPGSRGDIQSRLVRWTRDVNHNFIDDLIDVMPPNQRVDLEDDFNSCVTCDRDVLEFLAGLGTIDYVGTVVTFAAVLDVRVSDIARIAAREEVAMVELLIPAHAVLDTSVQAVKVTGPFFSPQTVRDADPTLLGTGVTIAVLDTGVDNAPGAGTTHTLFLNTGTAFGANCMVNPCVETDPDDDNGHGTAVAGVALGRRPASFPGVPPSGIAPGAQLVDVKVLGAAGFGTGASVLRGLELVIRRRQAWGVDVLNVSLGDCRESNGLNVAAMLLNVAASSGITVVVAVGNTSSCTPHLPTNANLIDDFASASLAIAVGAIDDHNTVTFDEAPPITASDPPIPADSLADFSLTGPRRDDHNGDPRDELKPEISAPGVNILTSAHDSADGFTPWLGTSFAAPHVAGVAALLIQQNPGINPGSLKELLIQTAAQSYKPGPHPGWHPGWGHGFLDAFGAFLRGATTDVGYPTAPPYPPCLEYWCSPHISTDSPPVLNVPNAIRAEIANLSSPGKPSQKAEGVRICFGVYFFSNNNEHFYDLGCDTVDIPPDTTLTVKRDWTPQVLLIDPYDLNRRKPKRRIHACLQVSIDYPFDTDFDNNTLQRNVIIARSARLATRAAAKASAASEAEVDFRLENNLPTPAHMEVQVINPSQWNVTFLEDGRPVIPAFDMDPDASCAKDLVVKVTPPPDAQVGDQAEVTLRVLANGEPAGGVTILGMVTPPDCNANDIDDAVDIAEGLSQDLNGNGRPDECESSPLFFLLHGTALGGSVSLTIQGFSAPCTVIVPTTAGQTAADIAAAVATAVNASACFASQGITATSRGNQVNLEGLELDTAKLQSTITDPGIILELPALAIPALSIPALLVLAALLFVAGVLRLRAAGSRT